MRRTRPIRASDIAQRRKDRRPEQLQLVSLPDVTEGEQHVLRSCVGQLAVALGAVEQRLDTMMKDKDLPPIPTIPPSTAAPTMRRAIPIV